MDGHLILELDKYIDSNLCKKIIERFDRDPNKKTSFITNPLNNKKIYNLESRNSKEINISKNENTEWNDIFHELQRILSECIIKYDTEFRKIAANIGEDPDFLSGQIWKNRNLQIAYNGFSIQRIEPNSWYRWHHDCDYGKRILQCVFYLNTMKDCEGGSTRFISGREVNAEVGKVLIFPTSWSNFHCGSRIFNSPKYICTTSIHLNV